MLFYDIVSIVCLAAMVIGAVSVICKAFLQERSQRLAYLRSFKKGKCTVVFIPAVVLYWTGTLYGYWYKTGEVTFKAVVDSFFSALGKILELVALKYNTSNVAQLLSDSEWYWWAVYVSFALVAANAFMLAFSLFGQRLWESKREHLLMHGRKDLLLVFGNNEDNITICKSDRGNEKRRSYIVDKLNADAKSKLYFGDISYYVSHRDDKLVQKLVARYQKKQGKQAVTAVINTRNENRDMAICHAFIDGLRGLRREKDFRVDRKGKLEKYVGKQKQVFVNEGVTAIGPDAFKGTAVREVILPMSVTTIGENAFAGCPSLRYVWIPSSVTHIATTAFAGCSGVTVHTPLTGAFGENPEVNVVAEKDSVIISHWLDLSNFRIFVFGSPANEAIFESIGQNSYGCIRYVNKYQQMALDFIDRHPFARYLTAEHFDKTTSLVHEDVDINVFMLGFGDTNRQLFLASVANNQFVTGTMEVPRLKPVNYYIVDRAEPDNDRRLNHNYRHYDQFLLRRDPAAEYLPLPDRPAVVKYLGATEDCRTLDISDGRFYDILQTHATKPGALNFVIIAFGTDFENIDMAKMLAAKWTEWGIQNGAVFVKVRNAKQAAQLLGEDNERICHLIADEKECVFNIARIENELIYKMAMMRNQAYDLENKVKYADNSVVIDQDFVDTSNYQSRQKWYINNKKRPVDRESSMYCCLSLRSKLQLMGLDYCPAGTAGITALSEQEYLDWYAGKDLPDQFSYDGMEKPVTKYTNQFQVSRRRTMAVHEHLRWNSFMLSRGYVPASIEQIRQPNRGKDPSLRTHGNLTTFAGLERFRRIVSEVDWEKQKKLPPEKRRPFEELEEDNDVIRYDYQILDEAYWLLKANGMVIYDRDDPEGKNRVGRMTEKQALRA